MLVMIISKHVCGVWCVVCVEYCRENEVYPNVDRLIKYS